MKDRVVSVNDNHKLKKSSYNSLNYFHSSRDFFLSENIALIL